MPIHRFAEHTGEDGSQQQYMTSMIGFQAGYAAAMATLQQRQQPQPMQPKQQHGQISVPSNSVNDVPVSINNVGAHEQSFGTDLTSAIFWISPHVDAPPPGDFVNAQGAEGTYLLLPHNSHC